MILSLVYVKLRGSKKSALNKPERAIQDNTSPQQDKAVQKRNLNNRIFI
jgi:hypothetical protein